MFCWERKLWTSWLLTCCGKKSWAAEKSSKKVQRYKGATYPLSPTAATLNGYALFHDRCCQIGFSSFVKPDACVVWWDTLKSPCMLARWIVYRVSHQSFRATARWIGMLARLDFKSSLTCKLTFCVYLLTYCSLAITSAFTSICAEGMGSTWGSFWFIVMQPLGNLQMCNPTFCVLKTAT